jgi:hypothetical protein
VRAKNYTLGKRILKIEVAEGREALTDCPFSNGIVLGLNCAKPLYQFGGG